MTESYHHMEKSNVAPIHRPIPTAFTQEDRDLLLEIHAAITSIAKVANDVLPMLQGSPIARMLGIK